MGFVKIKGFRTKIKRGGTELMRDGLLARLDALRDRVPWAPGAALLVDGAPDAKGYTPFTLPDAKGALAATVAGLLGATDVAFGVVES